MRALQDGPRRDTFAQRPFFVRALETHAPTIGSFVDVEGKPYLLIAQPRTDGTAVSYVLVSYIDAGFLVFHSGYPRVPNVFDVVIGGVNGVVMAYRSDSEHHGDADVLQGLPQLAAAFATVSPGTFYADEPHDTPHVYAHVPFQVNGDEYGTLALAYHWDALVAKAHGIFYRHIVTLALVTLLAYLGIWYANRRVVYATIAHVEEVQRLKSEFVSFAAHQLRNPITTISLYGEILQDTAMKQKVPGLDAPLAGLTEGVQQLSALIDELLEVHRLDEGKVRVEPVRTDIARITREVLERFEPQRTNKRLVLKTFGVNKVLYATLDPMLFKHCVANLLSNAIKYTPEGGVLTVRLGPADKGIEVSVTDTGRGIAPDHLPHLFEPYYKAKVKRGRVHGSGLGLYLTRTFVELMGGSVHVSSVEGEGSRFTLYLPMDAEIEHNEHDAGSS